MADAPPTPQASVVALVGPALAGCASGLPGRLLLLLTEAAGAKTVVEIGTSAGYSGCGSR